MQASRVFGIGCNNETMCCAEESQNDEMMMLLRARSKYKRYPFRTCMYNIYIYMYIYYLRARTLVGEYNDLVCICISTWYAY